MSVVRSLASRSAGQWLGMAALLGGCQVATAADLFSVTVAVGAQTGSAGFTTAQDVFDGLRDANLQALVPAYNGTVVASMRIDYRGLMMVAAFPIVGSPQLDLSIPGVGIAQNFVGATREESRRLLRDYFKSGDALGRIMKALAAASPVDPIAGNPASLQSHMVASSYSRHFRQLAGTLAGRSLGRAPSAQAVPVDRPIWLAAAGNEGLGLGRPADDPAARIDATAGLDAARYVSAGLSSMVYSLPFSVPFATGPDHPLSLDGELQHADTEGAKTYAGNLGLAYRWRLHDGWYLVPSASVGASVARDLGAAGIIVSGALTNAYRLAEQADYVLWMGNAVNVLQTVKTTLGDYSFDPKLRNVAVTNGLVLSLTPSALLQNHWFEFSLADTRYTGSPGYDRRYDELGVALVRARRSGGGPATMRAELNFLDTTHSKGWGVKFQLGF